MKRIYCKDCKYFRFAYKIEPERCISKHLYRDTYYDNEMYFAKPKDKNKNNNCKDFEEKKSWWK